MFQLPGHHSLHLAHLEAICDEVVIGPLHCCLDSSSSRYVVVFDHHHVKQSHTVVVSPTWGLFSEESEENQA